MEANKRKGEFKNRQQRIGERIVVAVVVVVVVVIATAALLLMPV